MQSARQTVKVIAGLWAVLAICTAGCGRDSEPPPPEPTKDLVARVGSREITVDDVLVEIGNRTAAGRPVGSPKELVDDMVMRAALLERIDKTNLADDAAAKRRIESLLIGILKERELTAALAAIEISDADVEQEYERRKATDYTHPAQVRLSGLRLVLDKNASDAKRAATVARLREARERTLKTPPPGGRGPAAQGFGALAVQYTDDQVSRYRGGDLGWLAADASLTHWPDAVLDAARALSKGEMSEVIETDSGVYLVMKTDERAARVTPLARVQLALRQSLLVQRRLARRKAFADETLKSADVQVFSNRLAAIADAMPGPGEPGAGTDAPAPDFPPLKGVDHE